jgi:hypothetical protein
MTGHVVPDLASSRMPRHRTCACATRTLTPATTRPPIDAGWRPYYFPPLGVSEDDEVAAIQSGAIRAGAVGYLGRLRS